MNDSRISKIPKKPLHGWLALFLQSYRSTFQNFLLQRNFWLHEKCFLWLFWTPFWKIQKIPRKTSVVEFCVSDSSSPVYHLQLYRKLTPSQMFLLSVSRTFKIYMRTSVMKPFFLKVTCEISAYCNSVENSITNIFFPKQHWEHCVHW